MEKEYSWRRTEDAVIDLADILRGLMGQWKRIMVCAIAAAVLMGGYGWMKNTGNLEGKGTVQEAELSDAEKQAVEDAVRLKHEINGLETYLNSSVLMQLDPYHKSKNVMLYCIQNAKRRELPVITESYLNFIANGGAADMLLKTDSGKKLEKNCIAELISVSQKTFSASYQVVLDHAADSAGISEAFFCVEITGRNPREAEKMAWDIKNILKKFSVSVKETAGSHKLKCINSMNSETADSILQAQQHDKKVLLSSNRTALKAAVDAFSNEQLAFYHETAGIEKENRKGGSGEERPEKAVTGSIVKTVLKYMFFGISGSIFIYVSVYACWYILCGTVKSAEEMKRMYKFPVYGEIQAEDGGKHANVRGRKCSDTYGCTKEQVLKRLKTVLQKQGLKKLYVAADFPLQNSEKKWLEKMAEQMNKQEIKVEVSESASTDPAAWDKFLETGTVLMICKAGMTTYKMVDDAMEFYTENNIVMAGAVVFL